MSAASASAVSSAASGGGCSDLLFGNGKGQTCLDCQNAKCCAEATSCAMAAPDPAGGCAAFAKCLKACDPITDKAKIIACTQACSNDKQYAAGANAYLPVLQCMAMKCGPPCGF